MLKDYEAYLHQLNNSLPSSLELSLEDGTSISDVGSQLDNLFWFREVMEIGGNPDYISEDEGYQEFIRGIYIEDYVKPLPPVHGLYIEDYNLRSASLIAFLSGGTAWVSEEKFPSNSHPQEEPHQPSSNVSVNFDELSEDDYLPPLEPTVIGTYIERYIPKPIVKGTYIESWVSTKTSVKGIYIEDYILKVVPKLVRGIYIEDYISTSSFKQSVNGTYIEDYVNPNPYISPINGTYIEDYISTMKHIVNGVYIEDYVSKGISNIIRGTYIEDYISVGSSNSVRGTYIEDYISTSSPEPKSEPVQLSKGYEEPKSTIPLEKELDTLENSKNVYTSELKSSTMHTRDISDSIQDSVNGAFTKLKRQLYRL